MKVLEVYWGNGFGIILIEDPYDGLKCYAKSIAPGGDVAAKLFPRFFDEN